MRRKTPAPSPAPAPTSATPLIRSAGSSSSRSSSSATNYGGTASAPVASAAHGVDVRSLTDVWLHAEHSRIAAQIARISSGDFAFNEATDQVVLVDTMFEPASGAWSYGVNRRKLRRRAVVCLNVGTPESIDTVRLSNDLRVAGAPLLVRLYYIVLEVLARLDLSAQLSLERMRVQLAPPRDSPVGRVAEQVLGPLDREVWFYVLIFNRLETMYRRGMSLSPPAPAPAHATPPHYHNYRRAAPPQPQPPAPPTVHSRPSGRHSARHRYAPGRNDDEEEGACLTCGHHRPHLAPGDACYSPRGLAPRRRDDDYVPQGEEDAPRLLTFAALDALARASERREEEEEASSSTSSTEEAPTAASSDESEVESARPARDVYHVRTSSSSYAASPPTGTTRVAAVSLPPAADDDG